MDEHGSSKELDLYTVDGGETGPKERKISGYPSYCNWGISSFLWLGSIFNICIDMD